MAKTTYWNLVNAILHHVNSMASTALYNQDNSMYIADNTAMCNTDKTTMYRAHNTSTWNTSITTYWYPTFNTSLYNYAPVLQLTLIIQPCT